VSESVGEVTDPAAPAKTGENKPNTPLAGRDGGDAGLSPDAEADAGPATCEACSTNTCAAQRTACEEDAICPLLKKCLDECESGSCKSACLATYPDATAKAKNGALFKCECVTSCATECTSECS
jgi:hypothetical protein